MKSILCCGTECRIMKILTTVKSVDARWPQISSRSNACMHAVSGRTHSCCPVWLHRRWSSEHTQCTPSSTRHHVMQRTDHEHCLIHLGSDARQLCYGGKCSYHTKHSSHRNGKWRFTHRKQSPPPNSTTVPDMLSLSVCGTAGYTAPTSWAYAFSLVFNKW